MKQKQGLFCFSPPVMIATFVAEMAMLIFIVWRYKMSPLVRLVSITLLCLATFQLAEYQVCGNYQNAMLWSRVGYVAITLLPALGVHLIQTIAGKKGRLKYLTALAYGPAAVWSGVFMTGDVFKSHVCTGNYVIFKLQSPLGGGYFVYYYLLLFAGTLLAWHYAQKVRSRARGQSLKLMIAGYLVFLLPTAVTNSLAPETIQGIPSIMCGFAVLFALILTFGVTPRVAAKAKSRKALSLR